MSSGFAILAFTSALRTDDENPPFAPACIPTSTYVGIFSSIKKCPCEWKGLGGELRVSPAQAGLHLSPPAFTYFEIGADVCASKRLASMDKTQVHPSLC